LSARKNPKRIYDSLAHIGSFMHRKHSYETKVACIFPIYVGIRDFNRMENLVIPNRYKLTIRIFAQPSSKGVM